MRLDQQRRHHTGDGGLGNRGAVVRVVIGGQGNVLVGSVNAGTNNVTLSSATGSVEDGVSRRFEQLPAERRGRHGHGELGDQWG